MGAAGAGHRVVDVPAGVDRGGEGGPPDPGRVDVVADVAQADLGSVGAGDGQLAGARRRKSGGVERRQVGPASSEQGQHPLQDEPTAGRAEQAPVPGQGMPADGDPGVGERADVGGGQPGRHGAHVGLGGAAGVQFGVQPGGVGADGGGLVVVTGHGEGGAGQPGYVPVLVCGPDRFAGGHQLGEQRTAWRRSRPAPRPTSRAGTGRASRCVRPATARSPGRRRGRARSTPPPRVDARRGWRPRRGRVASGAWSATTAGAAAVRCGR